jgi:hypothetical protein
VITSLQAASGANGYAAREASSRGASREAERTRSPAMDLTGQRQTWTTLPSGVNANASLCRRWTSPS